MSETKQSEKIDCYKCQHFYITWQASFPYGCRAMGFKSRRSPAQEVVQTSHVQCLLFLHK
ncbi:MAG TPA: uracil-DNA glycosylase [Gammaproteobacteria bacterium]|nr:uracil-DNA glycosylase [Gammaproteobacteria bacterium]